VRLLVPSAALLARDAGILGLLVDGGVGSRARSPIGGAHSGPLPPDLHRAMRRATLPHLPGLSRLIRRHLPLAPFFAHDCGYMILLLLLRDGRDGGDGLVTSGYQRLATQTGVSRTHVRRIVEAARDAGLLTTTARGGHDIRLTPAMWHAADRWFADKFALTDLLLREAVQGRTGKSDSQDTTSP
jgi:biotin operon repressor